MLILEINAATTDDDLESAIPFLDMREHAVEQRGYAAAAQLDADDTVLELHRFDNVIVLWSPTFAYAYVNERSTGSGNSMVTDNDEAPTPEHAARQWNERIKANSLTLGKLT